MSNAPGNALANISINGNLNMDDVLTVVTSRAETSFNQNLSDAKRVVAGLDKEIRDKDKQIKDTAKAESLAIAGPHEIIVRAAIEKLGGTVKVEEACECEGKLQVKIVIKTQGQGHYNNNADFVLNAAKSPELVAMEADLVILKEDKAKAEQTAMEWKRKLAGIPQLERRYKAKIAEAKLAESTDGQAVLAILTDDLEQQMLALPSN